jgi:spermidine/putrescine transport system substrate-binding protein
VHRGLNITQGSTMTKPTRRLSSDAAEAIRQLTKAGLLPARAQGSGPSRRQMLTGAAGLGTAAALAACGTGTTTTGTGAGALAKPTAAQDKSATEKIVNWANWTLYLDYDDKTKAYPSLEQFKTKTGIKATYAEDIKDNTEYYAKIQAQLRLGQDMGKDLIVLTDWMASKLIRQGFVQQFDDAAIPNKKNILPGLLDVDYDKGRHQSLTWQSGFTGVAWNTKEVNKLGLNINAVSDLWNPALKGRVEVLSEMRDAIGMILLDQGKKPEEFTDDEFNGALSVLETQLNNGQIRQIKGNSYAEDLKSGDALAVIGWSGDITALNAEAGDKFSFAIPNAGGLIWSDNLMIPIGSPHKKNAEELIDFYYDPKIAAEVAAYVNYVCPVQGAHDELLKIDAKMAASKLIFPDQPMLDSVHMFKSLSVADDKKYQGAFQSVLGV